MLLKFLCLRIFILNKINFRSFLRTTRQMAADHMLRTAGLMVTFAVIKLSGPRFKPRQGRHSDRDFCFMHTPKPRHRNQKWYLCRSQAWTRREGWWWGA